MVYTDIMSVKRTQTSNGTFRPVRSDTKVSTIEKRYGVDLGVRSDMTVGTYLNKNGYPSLSSMLKNAR